MNKYNNGKIYNIVCRKSNDRYIGSTIYELNTRLSGHKHKCKLWKEGKLKEHTTSFDIISNEDYYIELIEDYPCESKKELNEREAHWIKSMECVNKNIPGRTLNEWRLDNPNYSKEYHQTNYDVIKEQNATYRENHREELREYARMYREKKS